MEPNGTPPHTGSQQPAPGPLGDAPSPAGRPEVPGGPGDISCEVVIIGAGVAGLTAANELLKRDPDTRVCVIEANGGYFSLLFRHSQLC